MRCIVVFFDQAKKAIVESSGENKITMNIIMNQMKHLMIRVTKLKFEVLHVNITNDIKLYRIPSKLDKNLTKSSNHCAMRSLLLSETWLKNKQNNIKFMVESSIRN